MVRTQLRLTDSQASALKRLAAEKGASVAALVRESVDLYLKTGKQTHRGELIEKALRLSGKFSSGSEDGSANHDSLLESFP